MESYMKTVTFSVVDFIFTNGLSINCSIDRYRSAQKGLGAQTNRGEEGLTHERSLRHVPVVFAILSPYACCAHAAVAVAAAVAAVVAEVALLQADPGVPVLSSVTLNPAPARRV